MNEVNTFTAPELISHLYIHPMNTRSEPPAQEIEDMAASIRAIGLLQNLLGFDDPERPGKIGIVAGGRRLRALRLIAAEAGGDIPVPVTMTQDRQLAQEWAGAENTARRALHPADEVIAYRRMAADGADATRIATAFGVTQRHVLSRMKLAQLPDPAIEALRAGKISLDQAAALTVARSEDAVLELLPRIAANSWDARQPAQIRDILLPSAVPVSDRRLRFIGLDLYVAAGGEVQESLFFEESRALDSQLIDKLFADQCKAAAERLAEETGWARVEVLPETYMRYEQRETMQQVHRVEVELSEADQEELESLAEASELGELTEEQLRRFEELEARAEGDFSDADRAEATAYYTVNQEGELTFYGAFRALATGEENEDGIVKVKPETMPQNLIEDLRIIQTLSIQTALLDQPEVVLTLLALSLASPLWPHHKPLAISPNPARIKPARDSATVIHARLQDTPEAGRDDLTAEAYTAARDMPAAERSDLIHRALVRTFNRAYSDFGTYLAGEIGAHPRDVWTPNADNFFKRVPGGMMDAIWEELVPADRINLDDFRALKKADKAKQLDALFNDMSVREALQLSREQNRTIDRWVPDLLRWPHLAELDAAEVEAKPATKRRRKST